MKHYYSHFPYFSRILNLSIPFRSCLTGLITTLLTLSSFTACSMKNRESLPDMNAVRIGYTDSEDSAYNKGVSGAFSGKLGNHLFLGGGCNFPDRSVAEGGIKKYYDSLYRISLPLNSESEWTEYIRFPEPVGYGITFNMGDTLIFAGGMNNERRMCEVRMLCGAASDTWQDLPSLPFTMDNMSGASIGRILYLAGGNCDGVPSNRLLSFDLDNPEKGWVSRMDFPGEPRIQPVLTAQHTSEGIHLFLTGGFAPAHGGHLPTVSMSAYRYAPERNRWRFIASPLMDGKPVSLGGATGFSYGKEWLLFAGGVDRNIFLQALLREHDYKRALADQDTLKADVLRNEMHLYLTRPKEWYAFNDRLLAYHVPSDRWSIVLRHPDLARAGATVIPCEEYTDRIILFNGELKPGFRSSWLIGLRINE